jgi:predicted phosphodiesterase
VQFLILSDIHANWYALEAVLADAAGEYQDVICCGDLVGYNPHPGRVVEWVRANCSLVIRGNHDKVVAGIEDLSWFNEVAQAAARWTISQMDETALRYLRELEPGPLTRDGFQIWHGSLADEDEYVATAGEAAPSFPIFDKPLAFFGHTHLQGGFLSKRNRVGPIAAVPKGEPERAIELDPEALYMINPGSVGQPRDGDPRAAYALFDPDQRVVKLRRVAYPIQRTVEDIRNAGLPDVLWLRLFQGF